MQVPVDGSSVDVRAVAHRTAGYSGADLQVGGRTPRRRLASTQPVSPSLIHCSSVGVWVCGCCGGGLSVPMMPGPGEGGGHGGSPRGQGGHQGEAGNSTTFRQLAAPHGSWAPTTTACLITLYVPLLPTGGRLAGVCSTSPTPSQVEARHMEQALSAIKPSLDPFSFVSRPGGTGSSNNFSAGGWP